jgi:hypothetical protein
MAGCRVGPDGHLSVRDGCERRKSRDAALATLLERRSQIHRAILRGNISNLNSATRAYTDNASSRLMSLGYSSPTFRIRELAMANGILNRQSTMMAYDDAFTLLFWLFALTIPLTILLPRRGIPKESD